MTNKMTKREMFEILAGFIPEEDERAAELHEFCTKQIDIIDRKTEKAKVRNAERKAAGDELRDMVFGALTEELQTIPQIMEAMDIDDPEITRAKVTARLGQLVKAGDAEKIFIPVDGKRKVHYKIAG